ncbi:MAG TPA: FtsX-like permease family protein [Candidatus Didemnitutus sp.]|jgi:putative ABC transport system permease protein
MNFILTMAWRDTRASRRRLLLFSLSIVLGIAALVAVGSLRDNLSAAIDTETKSLLGADLVLESRAALSPEASAFIASLGGEQAREESFNSMLVAGSGGATRLVQVRALSGGFPFFGDFQTDPPGLRPRLASGAVAIPDETVLVQFGLKTGDTIRLGGANFTVLGGLLKVPGETAVFASFAPRIYIPLDRVEGTGLLKPGSLVRHRVYLKFPPGTNVEALVERDRDRIRSLRLSADTVEERKRDLGRSLTSVNAFLSIVGFAALFLGAIGVASAVHAHVRQKIPTVAILRCLGASSVTSFSVYLVQGMALGVVGTALGTALGLGASLLLPHLVRDFLPFAFTVTVSWPAVGRGVGAGLVVSLAFALLPLLEVRRVSPLQALRSAVGEGDRRDPLRVLVLAMIVLLVVAFAVWQTGRWSLGLGLAGGLFACFGILAGMARLVALGARRLRVSALPFAWRQGIANLHRPGNRTLLLLVSLGLGAFLMMTLYLSRGTLLDQLRQVGGGDRPNLMLFDIQDDQRTGLAALLRAHGAPVTQEAAIVTMRIAGLKGKPVAELLKEDAWRNRAWTLRHEYRSTYRDRLSSTERITAGKFTGRANPSAGPVPVSLEESVARDMRVGVGDTLDFDVQGVTIHAIVGSLREVEWRRMQPNFFIVFPEGVLEDAPKFHVMAVRAETPADSARIQQAVVRDYPNVSAIDLSLIIQTIDDVYSKASFVVGFLALFTVITGVIVLAGAVIIGRHQRVRESVLLRTLGATRRQISRLLLAEYLVLGTLGALTGILLAVGANWAVARFIFDLPWVTPSPTVLFAGWAGVTAVTVATGLWASRGLGNLPPLEILRQET